MILNRPALKDAAKLYRGSGTAWHALAQALLPDDVAPFKQAREWMTQRHTLFVEQGGDSLAERERISQRLAAIRSEMDRHFPLTASEVDAQCERLRDHVLKIHDLERKAYAALQAAMGSSFPRAPGEDPG